MTEQYFYIGTQGEGTGDGVWGAALNDDTGHILSLRLVAPVDRPTWLHRHAALKILYGVSEVGNRDARDGRLHAWRIDDDGSLSALNDVSARGGGPTDLAMDGQSSVLFVANFGGGQASAIPVARDGSLEEIITQCVHYGSGPHRRQTKPHPHGVTLDPSGHFLLAPDMGADMVFIHKFDPSTRELIQDASRNVALPAGSGPRLLRFGSNGKLAYLLSELSAEIYTFAWDEMNGELGLLSKLALDPEGAEGDPSAAALVLSDDGRHLYASNRRTHAIHVFEIDTETGLLSPVQTISSGGERPWSACLAPTGKWLLVTNQASDLVTVFRRDIASGSLEMIEDGGVSVSMPSCVVFL